MIKQLAIALVVIDVCNSGFAEQSPGDEKGPAVLHQNQLKDTKQATLQAEYLTSSRSIEALEKFVRSHPDEKAYCAGALLNLARQYVFQGRKNEALSLCQRVIVEYPDQLLPVSSMSVRAKDAALYLMGRLECELGDKEKALEIFQGLMSSGDRHYSQIARMQYLSIKQSHLEVLARVATGGGRKRYAAGDRMPVAVSVENPTEEAVTIMYDASLTFRKTIILSANEGVREATVAPGEKRELRMTFDEKGTKRLGEGYYRLEASIRGAPFMTDSLYVEIRNKPVGSEPVSEDTYVFSEQKPVDWHRTHMIQRGESLSQIAVSYKVSLPELAELNGIEDINMIYAGQELQLPMPSKKVR